MWGATLDLVENFMSIHITAGTYTMLHWNGRCKSVWECETLKGTDTVAVSRLILNSNLGLITCGRALWDFHF